MNKKFSIYLKILLICLVLILVFVAVFGVTIGIAGVPVNDIPKNLPYFTNEAPDEYGLLINFDLGESVFLKFDAVAGKTAVLFLKSAAKSEEVAEFGYEVDDTAIVSYDFLAEFIDRFGGIEIADEKDGFLNYTGVQITEKLSKTSDREFRKDIIKKLFSNICNQGVEIDDLLFIIENTEITLNYPKSYHLPQTIGAALGNVFFVN